jgi:hypothetical protein
MRYVVLGVFGAIAGSLAGVCYARFLMSPPPPILIDGHTYDPCGLAMFPMAAKGILLGAGTGLFSGLIAAKLIFPSAH